MVSRLESKEQEARDDDDIRKVEDSCAQPGQAQAHEIRDRTTAEDAIEPICQASSGDQGQPCERRRGRQAHAEGRDADERKKDGNAAHQQNAPHSGWKLGTKAQKGTRVCSEFEAHDISDQRDRRSAGKGLVGELLRGMVASDRAENQKHEQE